jgi:rare lipoprotein A
MTCFSGPARLFTAFFAILAIVSWLAGCRSALPPEKTAESYVIDGQWYHPIPDSRGFKESGMASWYGDPFHGRKTASGETYNMHARTAAHKTLPMGTFLLVENTANNKKTIVRINDRGPFVSGRIIDLSHRAAREIDMIGPGTAPVKIMVLEKDHPDWQKTKESSKDFYTGDFTVQIGAFSDHGLAANLKNRLEKDYPEVALTRIKQSESILYRVRVGRFSSLQEARKAENRLIRAGYKDAFAVALDSR